MSGIQYNYGGILCTARQEAGAAKFVIGVVRVFDGNDGLSALQFVTKGIRWTKRPLP